MKEDKVCLEVAEVEFNRFVELMDLDCDEKSMGDEDRQGFTEQKEKLIKAICKGSLVVNEEGEPIFTPQRTKDAKPITFYEPTGASLMAMDRKKKTEDVAKLYATMADMTRTDSKTFAKMKNADLKVCMAITTLFLA
jgi:hypothetical protein